MSKMTYDSLIFDMDGTLWDAVDSYCMIWERTLSESGIKHSVSRQELLDCMGMPINEIFKKVIPTPTDAESFLNRLDQNEQEMMPQLGGKLYPGVKEGIPELALRYRLFMVSNCGADGLRNFLSFTGLSPYIDDSLTHGETHQSKAENIKMLIARNNLKNPIYVGDTQGDCDSAHQAGIPMVFTTYGFGKCNNAEYSVDSFGQLTELFLSKTEQ